MEIIIARRIGIRPRVSTNALQERTCTLVHYKSEQFAFRICKHYLEMSRQKWQLKTFKSNSIDT